MDDNEVREDESDIKSFTPNNPPNNQPNNVPNNPPFFRPPPFQDERYRHNAPRFQRHPYGRNPSMMQRPNMRAPFNRFEQRPGGFHPPRQMNQPERERGPLLDNDNKPRMMHQRPPPDMRHQHFNDNFRERYPFQHGRMGMPREGMPRMPPNMNRMPLNRFNPFPRPRLEINDNSNSLQEEGSDNFDLDDQDKTQKDEENERIPENREMNNDNNKPMLFDARNPPPGMVRPRLGHHNNGQMFPRMPPPLNRGMVPPNTNGPPDMMPGNRHGMPQRPFNQLPPNMPPGFPPQGPVSSMNNIAPGMPPPFMTRPDMMDSRMRFPNRPDFRPPNESGNIDVRPRDGPFFPGHPLNFPIPFRPPLGMPPPNFPNQFPPVEPAVIPATEKPLTIDSLNDENVWIQNPTADGRSYFYNWKTRQTTWERPTGVKILMQTELDAIVANKNQTIISSAPVQSVQVPPVQVTKPAEVLEWNEYKAPDGRMYYHNRRSGVTTWDKPQVLLDWEKTSTPAAETTLSENTNKAEEAAEPKEESSDSDDESAEDEEDQNDGSKSKDTSKPVSSNPVSGTPWCIVWTGDGRVFFFNPAKRLSVWERPEELKGRGDVDRLLEEPPKDSVKDKKQSDINSDEPPAKRSKISTSESSDDHDADQSDYGANESNEVSKEIIPLSKEAAKEAADRAAKERALLPLETRLTQFKELLIEKQVSAFSTWEKELHKIVFDSRYLLLTSKERKTAFETFIKERADEERKEKKLQQREKKDAFRKLLKEANLNSKSSFADFSNKYSKDERYKGIDKSRDRESLFSDFISDIKKKDKEDKHKDKAKQNFISLLKEQKISKSSHWSDIKKKIDDDSRYKAVESSSKREEWFKDYLKKIKSESADEKDKRDRQEASLREREKEVKESLSSALRDRDKERDNHLKSEAEQSYKVLLTDVVKNADDAWKDVKRLLRKDDRWSDISDQIDRDTRELIFKDHISSLKKKSKKK